MIKLERAEDVVFKKGPQSTMDDIPLQAGSLLVATDTGNVFLDTDKEIDIPDSELTNTETVRIQLKDDTKLPLTGGSITGDLSITGNVEVHSSANQSYLSIDTSNQTTLVLYDTTGNIGTQISADNLVLSDTAKNNWKTTLEITEGFTEEEADAKYLQLSGGTVTGQLDVTGALIVSGDSVFNGGTLSIESTSILELMDDSSVVTTSINGQSGLTLDSNLKSQWQSELQITPNALDQSVADDRYLKLTGGTLTGSLRIAANQMGTLYFEDDEVTKGYIRCNPSNLTFLTFDDHNLELQALDSGDISLITNGPSSRITMVLRDKSNNNLALSLRRNNNILAIDSTSGGDPRPLEIHASEVRYYPALNTSSSATPVLSIDSSGMNCAVTAKFDGTNGIQIGNIKIIYNPDEDGLQFIKATT